MYCPFNITGLTNHRGCATTNCTLYCPAEKNIRIWDEVRSGCSINLQVLQLMEISQLIKKIGNKPGNS